MLEQLSNALVFSAFYTAAKLGKAELADVTVDVYNPANTKIVTAAAATAVGGGLYQYTLGAGSVATEGSYKAIFKTGDATVDVKELPALWVVGTAGIENLVPSGTLADSVWDELLAGHVTPDSAGLYVKSTYTLLYGPGSTEYQIKAQTGGAVPIENAHVWITSTNDPSAAIRWEGITNASGYACKIGIGTAGFWYDPTQTGYIWVAHPSYVFAMPTTWVTGVGGLTKTITGTAVAGGTRPTVTEALAELRLRLNDVDEGAYTPADLLSCLNAEYMRQQMLLRCYIQTESVALAMGVHTYDSHPIFEPIEVSLSGDILAMRSFGDMGVSLETWNQSANDTPTEWMRTQGSFIRVHPTPDATGTLIVHGYGVAAKLTSGNDQPLGLPAGFDWAAWMDGAEMEARKRRAQYSGNAGVIALLLDWVKLWVEKARASVKGGG